jgi:ferric-dicitrate binding protein FerR (iron transport regulator)
MEPDKQQPGHLFNKFIEGDSTKEEEKSFWTWLYLLDIRSAAMLQRPASEQHAIKEEVRSAVLSQINQRRLLPLTWWKIAAAAAIVIFFFTLFYIFLPTGQRHAKPMATVLSNDNKTVRTFYLPDSTMVVLNRSERRVSLTGEGYFEIHQDSKRPFIVEGGGLEVKALGTAFTVEAYNDESEMRVALLNGKVQVTDSGKVMQRAVLSPGQLMRYRYAQQAMKVEKIHITDPLAWTNDGMTFNRIPLTEALNRLALRYGINVVYDANQLQGKFVSGSFNATTWEKLLPNILGLHNLKYTVKDSTVHVDH